MNPLDALMPIHADLSKLCAHRASAVKSDWISIRENLPEKNSPVLVHSPTWNQPVWIGYWDGDRWCSPSGEPLRHFVTHWTPLPEPPQP